MPRLAKNQETRRLNLELNEAVRVRLEELRDEVGADSLTEVIRRALALYDYLWIKRQQGDEIVVKGKDGERAIEFF